MKRLYERKWGGKGNGEGEGRVHVGSVWEEVVLVEREGSLGCEGTGKGKEDRESIRKKNRLGKTRDRNRRREICMTKEQERGEKV